ncbi:hypothetical protein B0H10DRAFT_1956746 [Mycena sp. CBHHK59/15]|nr:hypothetical protein B0H10DRAFT_1956746 [Mycena sp. CBHHK59/15]
MTPDCSSVRKAGMTIFTDGHLGRMNIFGRENEDKVQVFFYKVRTPLFLFYHNVHSLRPKQLCLKPATAAWGGLQPDAENVEALAIYRAMLLKSAETSAKHQATLACKKNLQNAATGTAVASPALPPSTIIPQAVTPRPRQPTTPSSARLALQSLPAQPIGIAPTSSLLSSFPVHGGSVASSPAQTGPRHRTMALPQYPDLQAGAPHQALTVASPFSSRLASMTAEDLDKLDSMLQLMQQGMASISSSGGPHYSPLDLNLLTSFPPQLRDHGGDAQDDDFLSFGNTSFGDSDILPRPSSWNGEHPATPEPSSGEDPIPSHEDAKSRSDVDDRDNPHRSAQSSLVVQMQDVPVHQQRRRQRKAATTAAPAADSCESETDEHPAQRRHTTTKQKKKKCTGRHQPSQSIKDIAQDRQSIVKAAYPLIQREVVCTSGFPVDSPSGMQGASDDEYSNMVLDSWDDSHEVLGVSHVGNPATPEKNLVRVCIYLLARTRCPTGLQESGGITGAWSLRLINPQTLPNLTPELKAKTIEANRTIIAKIEHTFYYLDPYNATIPDTIRLQSRLFWQELPSAGHYFHKMDAAPVETIALIITATGQQEDVRFDSEAYAAYYNRVLVHLRGWVAYTATQSIDVAGTILKEMLRAARESSSPVEEDKPEEDVFLGFSAGAYAINQPSAS